MSHVFGQWFCNNCNRKSLCQERKQEEVSFLVINQKGDESSRKPFLTSGCSTTKRESITHKLSLNSQEFSNFYKTKGNHKITLKSNSLKPQHQLNSIQTKISESAIMDIQPYERLPTQQTLSNQPISYKSQFFQSTPKSKEEYYFVQRINTVKNKQKDRLSTAKPSVRFQYKSVEQQNSVILRSSFQKFQSKKINCSPADQPTNEDAFVQSFQSKENKQFFSKEKCVKFIDFEEVNQYSQKYDSFEQDDNILHQTSVYNDNLLGHSFTTFTSFRRNDSQLTNMYTQFNENEDHEKKEQPKIHHLESHNICVRRQRKNFTTFVPFQEAKKTKMKTVKTIKSIDSGSEGSIIDSHFMKTVADNKEITKLI